MQLALIVSLIALGATVLVGVLGFLIEKNADATEHKPDAAHNPVTRGA
jgi:hypothetical protein